MGLIGRSDVVMSLILKFQCMHQSPIDLVIMQIWGHLGVSVCQVSDSWFWLRVLR